jgi:hypothetical protein
VAPTLEQPGRNVPDRRLVERAVVQLDPSLVDLDRGGQGLRRLARPTEGAGDHHVGSRQHRRQARRLRPPAIRQLEVGAPEVATPAIRLGFAVADEQ